MNVPPPISASRSAALLAAGGLVLAAGLAYSTSLSGPFVYDDGPAIVDNASLRHFAAAFFPPAGTTVSGRPLVNLSLAFNYAVSGSAVGSYHLLNVLIHLGAGLALFGLIRCTLLLPSVRERYGSTALPIALAAALLWTVHPLQTEAVTYVVQRAESLMGLFYLLTLYAFARAVDWRPFDGENTGAQKRWLAATVIACVLGMACKEVMVSAPLMVLLYDRTFAAGSFAAAWNRRKGFYLTLAASWVPLAFLVASTGGNRGGTVGLDVGVPWWAYGLTQFRAVARYLALSFWPAPLVFEYGTFWENDSAAILPDALLVVALGCTAVVALWRWPRLGFLGFWFFAMLAPTSLIPGTTQMIVEHRMYLSLAAVLLFAVLGVHAWLGRRVVWACLLPAAVCVILTARRNADYRTEVSLWSDTVEKRPANALAHCNLAIALVKQQRIPDALQHYELSLSIAPHAPNTHYNYGILLARLGRPDDAIAHYEQALRSQPVFPSAESNLGILLYQTGHASAAIPHLEHALLVRPDDAETHCNLANALFQAGRGAEALPHYERAIALQPADADNHYNFANTLLQFDRPTEAIAHYETALKLRPDDADTHCNLGLALVQVGRTREAAGEYERALQLRPDFPTARENLARLHASAAPVKR